MKIYRYILIAFVLVVLSSCSVTSNRMYAPDSTRLNLTMDDLEYLGEAEISVEYRTYFGLISVIDQINGIPYDGKEIKTVRIGDKRDISLRLYSKLNRAQYKLLDEFPEAEYFVVVSQTKSTERMFLGSYVNVKAKIKAYSLK